YYLWDQNLRQPVGQSGQELPSGLSLLWAGNSPAPGAEPSAQPWTGENSGEGRGTTGACGGAGSAAAWGMALAGLYGIPQSQAAG
ncbi:hypothetical protein P7K49_008691, partial [Saguinus oedipus]